LRNLISTKKTGMKEKIRIEYIMNNVSMGVLWNSIGTANGLSDWFADKVSVNDKIYTFEWNKSQQQAELVSMRVGYYIRFHWCDDDPKTYFELKIVPDELTGDVALIITDYASDDEKKDLIDLWNKQIKELKRKYGM